MGGLRTRVFDDVRRCLPDAHTMWPVNQRWDDLVGISAEPLDAAALVDAVRDESAGALVSFLGTVRDHSEGRSGVTALSYEVYEEPALDRMRVLVATARDRWPSIRKIALVHRRGELRLGDDAVCVAVSAPHRGDAFEAASWLIDEAKTSLPIWKEETYEGGTGFGVDAAPITATSVSTPTPRAS